MMIRLTNPHHARRLSGRLLATAALAWLAIGTAPVLSEDIEEEIEPYDHQEEAILELFAGRNVILNTPTGSGKSLVALAMHFKAFAEGRGVREVALEMDVLPVDELDAALDVRPMTEGG